MSATFSTPAIAPCPFCGSDAATEPVVNLTGPTLWRVRCKNYNGGCAGSDAAVDRVKDAVALWNKRTNA